MVRWLTMELVLCPSCSRHVSVDEVTCPFCTEAGHDGGRAVSVGRNAWITALLGASLVGVACTRAPASGAEAPTSPAPRVTPVPPYGVPPIPTPTPSPTPSPTRVDAPRVTAVPAYGVAPIPSPPPTPTASPPPGKQSTSATPSPTARRRPPARPEPSYSPLYGIAPIEEGER
jgi:hypothetical protein